MWCVGLYTGLIDWRLVLSVRKVLVINLGVLSDGGKVPDFGKNGVWALEMSKSGKIAHNILLARFSKGSLYGPICNIREYVIGL